MSKVRAWLLDCGAETFAAVGGREILHLVDMPVTYDVPFAPPYCHRVLVWQDELLPLYDVASRVKERDASGRYVAVVGYQMNRGDVPQLGALVLAVPPRQIEVSNEQACPLPEEYPAWGELAISCFEHDGRAVPILNLKRMFMTPPMGA